MSSRYILFKSSEVKLLEEKAEKLLGITRILDNYLEEDFTSILAKKNISQESPRDVQVKILNEFLSPISDLITEAFPGVGAGYYCLELEAILTYGPSKHFGDKVGLSIDALHLGRQAMARRQEIVGVGPMVRGEIMACIHPLIRSGEVIGYTFASESLRDIYRQIEKGTREFFSRTIPSLF